MFSKLIIWLTLYEILITSVKPSKEAKCVLEPSENSTITGEVLFYQDSPTAPVTVKALVYGAKSVHGFHIHELAPINGDCMSTKGHYNPLNMTHGGPADEIRHNGDLGNLRVEGQKSVIEVKFTDRVISLYGNFTILGRGCVFHAFEDDLGRDGKDSKITGNAGPRLACGSVQLTESSSMVIFCFVFLFIAVFGLFFYIYYKSSDFKEMRNGNLTSQEEIKNT